MPQPPLRDLCPGALRRLQPREVVLRLGEVAARLAEEAAQRGERDPELLGERGLLPPRGDRTERSLELAIAGRRAVSRGHPAILAAREGRSEVFTASRSVVRYPVAVALSKRGSRRIEVDGVAYRWRLRGRPTEGQRRGHTPLIVAIAAEVGPGPALIVRHFLAHPGNTVGRHAEAVTPREVAALIREGIRAGWEPARPGPAFELELCQRVVLPGPEVRPGRRTTSREALERTARARAPGSCDRIELVEQVSGISINGIDLIAWVRAAELPHATREVAERRAAGDAITVDDIAGAYVGLGRLSWPNPALLGAPNGHAAAFALREDDARRDKVALLGCPCGFVECWFLLAQITVLDGFVVWSDFEQFHRPWSLELGPFVFERAAYLAAIGAPARWPEDPREGPVAPPEAG